MRRRTFLAFLGLVPLAPVATAKLAEKVLVPKPKPLTFMGIPVIPASGLEPGSIWLMQWEEINRYINPPVIYMGKTQYDKLLDLSPGSIHTVES